MPFYIKIVKPIVYLSNCNCEFYFLILTIEKIDVETVIQINKRIVPKKQQVEKIDTNLINAEEHIKHSPAGKK